LAKDPWSYQESAYEEFKRTTLLQSLPNDFSSLLEVGCADGHNLLAMSSRFPEPKLIGIDISTEAIQRARINTANHPKIELHLAKPGISAILGELHGTFDVMIFSEVLYYIGNKKAWQESLTPLKSLLHPGSIVIAVHPSSDSKELHDRLCSILGLDVVETRQYTEESRPFEIRIATLPMK
jgi:trans-aconitate methyltransferase